MNRIRGRALAFACCLAWAAAAPALAEVGIAISISGSQPTPYVMAQITDDSDPWGGAWKRFSNDPNRNVLNSEGFLNQDGVPSMEVLPDGRVLVAWARNSAQGYDVVASVHTASGWSAAQVIAASPENEVDPALAVETDGTVHVVYTVVGQDSRVMHRQPPSDLSLWSGELQVSQPGELARRPSAAWDGQALRVAYEVDTHGLGQTPRAIAAALLEDGAFDGEIVAVSTFAGDLAPRIHCTA